MPTSKKQKSSKPVDRGRKVDPLPAIPKQLTWLVKQLKVAYGEVRVLEFVGDLAKLLRKRQRDTVVDSVTTCIACGGGIPKPRESRGQHTCSEECQRWYKRLRRAMMAAKFCRYCGRPNNHPEAVRMRRPGRPKAKRQAAMVDAQKMGGSGRHTNAKSLRPGESVLLVPDCRDGVSLTAIEDRFHD